MRRTEIVQPVSGQLPIVVSRPDKLFWLANGYTKLDLVEYYNVNFLRLKPYVKERMQSLDIFNDSIWLRVRKW
jgi:DNA primase